MRNSIQLGLLAAALCGPALAQSAPADWMPTLSEILEPAGPSGRIAPTLGALETLSTLERVRLTDLGVPGAPDLVVELDRVRAFTGDSRVRIGNAEPIPMHAAVGSRYSTFGGVITGHPNSRVFLSFSEHGARGWIHYDDRTVHLLPEKSGQGSVLPSRFVDNAEISDFFPAERALCNTRTLNGSAATPPAFSPASYSNEASTFDPLCILELVLETDAEYLTKFSSSAAAMQYAMDIAAAMDATFQADLGMRITLSQLNIYDGLSDPYEGTNAASLHAEITTRWQEGLSAQGDAAMVLSGHGGDGGVAYLAGLCSEYSVGACCSITGDMPFPVTQGPLNWDFVVNAHELGHIIATPHTHDFCPPIDQCAPSDVFGACQEAQVCQTGTIMSYCHTCYPGIANMQPNFHPTIASYMRDGALSKGCIEKVPLADLCSNSMPKGIRTVSPDNVLTLVPDGPQVLTIGGCGFNDVYEVRVGGEVLETFPPQWYIENNTQLVVNLPVISGIGTLDIELVTPNETFSHPLEVQLTVEPTLDVVNSSPGFILQAVGMTAHVAGAPNDAAVLFASVDPNPTFLPGIIEAGLGGGNIDAVLILGVQITHPATGITTFQVPMQSLSTGFTFYTQAGLLRAANPVFPLVPTNVQAATILF